MTTMASRVSRIRRARQLDQGTLPLGRLLAIFAVVVVSCAILEPVFLTSANLKSALTTYVIEIALVTAGQTLVMVTAGIDLSVAGVVDLVGICAGILSDRGAPTGAIVAAGIAIGGLCGLLNGIVITRLKVPPIMVTLASGILFRGIAEGLANGNFYSTFPTGFTALGQKEWAGAPSQLWIAVVVLFLVGTTLRKTRYGRWVYAVGANLRAARLSGAPTTAAITSVYVASGVLSGIAALIMTARLASATPDMGAGLELASITAAVLGGVSVFGGKGTVAGAVLGVVTIAALKNGLTLQGVASAIQDMGVAALLVLVLLASRVSVRSLARLAGDHPGRSPDRLPVTSKSTAEGDAA